MVDRHSYTHNLNTRLNSNEISWRNVIKWKHQLTCSPGGPGGPGGPLGKQNNIMKKSASELQEKIWRRFTFKNAPRYIA